MPAWMATPDNSLVKSTIYPALADDDCARSFTAEPVASIAPRSPSLSSSPNICASLPILSTAPSPRSSPRATPILSAASTNSSISFVADMPSLPAAPASSFSCSREVRVSMFLKSSFIFRTSSSACPVYFCTFAIASSMSAYAFVASRILKERAVMLPIIPAIASML